MEPKLLLLDEPLSNLDARLRLEMRVELQRVQRETGVTMVFVTHDQSEALALADRIVVMRVGRIEQVGTPEEIYSGRPPASSRISLDLKPSCRSPAAARLRGVRALSVSATGRTRDGFAVRPSLASGANT